MYWKDKYRESERKRICQEYNKKTNDFFVKYGIEYTKLMPLVWDHENDRWKMYHMVSRDTDDGCEHYEYNGDHYTFSYAFKKNEWNILPRAHTSALVHFFCSIFKKH